MKGVIACCLRDLVKEKYGADKWDESLVNAGLPKSTFFLATDIVEDSVILKLIDSVCAVLSITPSQAAEAFGSYWVSNYATKMYKTYISQAKNAKDVLVMMDRVHSDVTKNIQNSQPPRFDYKWKNDKTLVMTYKSKRNLIEIFIGLIKGVGNHFKEELLIKKINDKEVEITFSY